jgi:hypothetical protein
MSCELINTYQKRTYVLIYRELFCYLIRRAENAVVEQDEISGHLPFPGYFQQLPLLQQLPPCEISKLSDFGGKIFSAGISMFCLKIYVLAGNPTFWGETNVLAENFMVLEGNLDFIGKALAGLPPSKALP